MAEQIDSRQNPYVMPLGTLDAKTAFQQAQWIRNNIPFLQKGTASGKFYQNYVSYGFWHDSQFGLIRDFVQLLEAGREKFESTFRRKLDLSLIYLSYVEDASEEICIWHKDGYWWEGQFHLTILGNANILVRDQGLNVHIAAENGVAWYLNGTEYEHKIQATHKGPRFELLAPCGFREASRKCFFEGVTSTPERWIDANHPAIKAEVKTAVDHVKNAIAEGTASNLNVAGWPVLPNNDIS